MKSITLTLDEFEYQAIRNALVHRMEYLYSLADQGYEIYYLEMEVITEVLFDLDSHTLCKPKSVMEEE